MSARVIVFLFSSPLRFAITAPFASTTTEFEAPIFSSSFVISKSSPNSPKNIPATTPAPITHNNKNITNIIFSAIFNFVWSFLFFSFLLFVAFLACGLLVC